MFALIELSPALLPCFSCPMLLNFLSFAVDVRLSRTRYREIVLAITIAVVQYVDRVAISQAKGGKCAGTVSGSMNMMGGFGGMVGPAATGAVLAATTTVTSTGVATKNWELVFAISSSIYFLGAIGWLFIDPVTPPDEPKKNAPAVA